MQTAITRTSGPGRVLLVDDHPAVRRVLRSLLEEVGGWQVAAGARGYVLKGDVPAAVLEALSAARQGQARLSAAVTGPVMEDLRELYEAAVSRSKELEAENADLSSTVARLEEVDRLKLPDQAPV
jgi:DNA-binding NarL/FixJ family response regulator